MNGATLTADRFGNANSAYSFDGVNDYIRTSNNITFTKQITIEVWVNPTIFDGYRSVVSIDYFELERRMTGGIAFWVAGIGGGKHSTSTSDLQVNTWSHVVGVYDGSNAKIYINGIQSGDSISINVSFNNFQHDILIGHNDAGTESARWWNGFIDDIRIYNRALTDAEILALYNEGK